MQDICPYSAEAPTSNTWNLKSLGNQLIQFISKKSGWSPLDYTLTAVSWNWMKLKLNTVLPFHLFLSTAFFPVPGPTNTTNWAPTEAVRASVQSAVFCTISCGRDREGTKIDSFPSPSNNPAALGQVWSSRLPQETDSHERTRWDARFAEGKQHRRWVHTCEFQRFIYLFPKRPPLPQESRSVTDLPNKPHSGIHRSPPFTTGREAQRYNLDKSSPRAHVGRCSVSHRPRTRTPRVRSGPTKGSRTKEPAQSRVPTRGWHARAEIPVLPPCHRLFPGHRRIHPPGRAPATRAELRQGEGERRDEQNPARTNRRALPLGFFSLFLSRPWRRRRQRPRARAPSPAPSAALATCRALSRHDGGAIAILSRHKRRCCAHPSPSALPPLPPAALTSLRRRGAAPRPPLSSPVPPPAAPWPRPPQVTRSRREGPAEGPARAIRVRHTPPAPARAQAPAAGPMRARCCRRLRPDAGKGGRDAAAEGGRRMERGMEGWRDGGKEGWRGWGTAPCRRGRERDAEEGARPFLQLPGRRL